MAVPPMMPPFMAAPPGMTPPTQQPAATATAAQQQQQQPSPNVAVAQTGAAGASTTIQGAQSQQPAAPVVIKKEEGEEEPDHGWKEHTAADGRKYYHNTKTKQSRWDKPEEMLTAQERLLMKKTAWREYTAANGRTYYYNTLTKQSLWQMPPELKLLKENPNAELPPSLPKARPPSASPSPPPSSSVNGIAQQQRDDDRGDVIMVAPSASQQPPQQEEESDDEGLVIYRDAKEAREPLMELFTSKGVTNRWKWEEASKLLQNDKRVRKQFSKLTTGEKRQMFAEYLSQAQKRAKELEREKRKQARVTLLEEIKKWPQTKGTNRYRDFAEMYFQSDWWRYTEENERDDAFQDFMEEHERTEREERRAKRQEYVEKVQSKFSLHPTLTADTRWRDVVELMKDDCDFKWLDKVDALFAWRDWVAADDRKADEEKRKKTYRTERKNRDAFNQLLEESVVRNNINAKTLWQDFMPTIKDDERYRNMLGQGGSTPRDLFEDKLEDLTEEYQDQKDIVIKILEDAQLKIKADTDWKTFHEECADHDDFKGVSAVNAKLIYESLLRKTKDEARHAEKEVKKIRRRFAELLDECDVPTDISYDAAMSVLKKQGQFEVAIEMVPDDRIRRDAFLYYCTHREGGGDADHHRMTAMSGSSKDDGKGQQQRHGGHDDDVDMRDRDRDKVRRERDDDSDSDEGHRRHKKRKDKKRRRDKGDASEDEEEDDRRGRRRKHKKSRHRDDDSDG